MSIKKTARVICADKATENSVRDFANEVIDFVHDMESVAGELGCDLGQYDMLFKIREMQRELDRQRKAIAMLKRGGSVLPPRITENSPGWG